MTMTPPERSGAAIYALSRRGGTQPLVERKAAGATALVTKPRRRRIVGAIAGCGILAAVASNLRLNLALPGVGDGALGSSNATNINHGGGRIGSGGNATSVGGISKLPPYRRYHEVATEVLEAVRQSPRRHNNYPSRADATVVHDATPWFTPRKACRETCCAATVAVSMSHESHKIINTVDGNDLADVRFQHYSMNDQLNKGVGASIFREEMIPCLLPGTIFEMDNHLTILHYFMYQIRPRMKHAYATVTMESDADSPQVPLLLEKDELLLKWHGTNPRRDALENNADKFRPMGLGLSFHHPQEKHLLPFLKLNNFTNPFAGRKERYDVTRHPLDFDEDIVVHFGNRDLEHRARLWEVLCGGGNETSTHTVTCNNRTFAPHDMYVDASRRRFGLSPPGVGWDCYRTYELLLLGVIPIVDGSPPLSRDLFEGLPVIFVRDMDETIRSRKDLLDIVARYVASDEFRDTPPEDFGRGWERLFLGYRRRLLLRDAGREGDILVDGNGTEYFQAFHYTVMGDGDGNEEEDIYCSKEGNCDFDEDENKLSWSIPTLTDSDRAFLERWNGNVSES